MMPLTKTTGDEDGHDGQRRGQGGEGDLLGPLEGGGDEALAAFAVAEDVLHDHDRVVDDDPDGQGHGQQGERVEGEAEEIDDGHRPEEGHRDGQDDVERRGQRAEEQPADEGGQEDGEEDLELDLPDRLLDEPGRVEDDRGRQALGQRSLEIVQGRPDAPGDGDGVRAPLLFDREALGGDAVEPGDPAGVVEAVLDEGDVVDVDGGAVDSRGRRCA